MSETSDHELPPSGEPKVPFQRVDMAALCRETPPVDEGPRLHFPTRATLAFLARAGLRAVPFRYYDHRPKREPMRPQDRADRWSGAPSVEGVSVDEVTIRRWDAAIAEAKARGWEPDSPAELALREFVLGGGIPVDFDTTLSVIAPNPVYLGYGADRLPKQVLEGGSRTAE